jgi:hypothetical protein
MVETTCRLRFTEVPRIGLTLKSTDSMRGLVFLGDQAFVTCRNNSLPRSTPVRNIASAVFGVMKETIQSKANMLTTPGVLLCPWRYRYPRTLCVARTALRGGMDQSGHQFRILPTRRSTPVPPRPSLSPLRPLPPLPPLRSHRLSGVATGGLRGQSPSSYSAVSLHLWSQAQRLHLPSA